MSRTLLLAVVLVLLPLTAFAGESVWGSDPGAWTVYYVTPQDLPAALHTLETRGEIPAYIVQAMAQDDKDCSQFGCTFDPATGQTLCVDPPPTGCPSTEVSKGVLFMVVCRR
jgi:hypothetical protein